MAFLLISIAVPLNFGLSFSIEMIMHPEPVPISNTCLEVLNPVYLNTSSTICSVSGLGINTSLETMKLYLQNSFFFMI